MSNGRIDLMAEVVTLFKDEDLIAFFQFERPQGSAKAISGLCKVARPRTRKAGLDYVSMDFIADVTGDLPRKRFDSVLEQLTLPAARRLLPGIDSVVVEAGATVGTDTYVKHVDLITKGKGPDVQAFIGNDLGPALHQACGMKCEEPIWWDDLKAMGATGHQPLLETIKRFFRG